MISIKNIRIPFNYALILPDPDYETYQIGGSETNIMAPSYTYQDGNRVDAKHKNYATTGTVYGVPESIRFTRDEIKAIQASIITERNGQNVVADSSLLYKINRLKTAGCRFETDNELSISDRVKFTHHIHRDAHYFNFEEGRMLFVKYDEIYMTLDGKMLNGFILVDPEKKETKTQDGITFTESETGLILPKLYGEGFKRSARWMHGTVKHTGRKIRGYFDFENYQDEDIEVNEGDKLIFDPRTAQQLETNTHQHLSEKKLYLIQRKDILFMEKENSNFEELCTI